MAKATEGAAFTRSHHFAPGDLRKLREQMGDIVQRAQSNKNYILTHGVSEVDWCFTKVRGGAPFLMSI
jgi:hypothetical protein